MKITLEPGDVFKPTDTKEKDQTLYGLVLNDKKCLVFSTGPKGPSISKSEKPEKDFFPMFPKDRKDIPGEILQVFDAVAIAMDLPKTLFF